MSYFPKKKLSDFIPAPEGLHFCVCADVVDLGLVKTSWQGQESIKDMVRIVWQTEEKMTTGAKTGQPFLINKRYTSSVHPKATLRIHVESWAGKKFTDEQFAAFDIERLIGHCCQIQIAHNISGGDTYANIMAIVPAPKGRPPIKVSGYTRVKDRPGYKPPAAQAGADAPGTADPFGEEEHGAIPEEVGPTGDGFSSTYQDEEIPF
jgi:hypothetical protein